MLKDSRSLESLINFDFRDLPSKKKHISKLYKNYIKTHKIKVFLLTILTFGSYLIILKTIVKKRFHKQLCSKKIASYLTLSKKIESVRKTISFTNPKSDIQKIYKLLLEEEQEEDLFKLYSKSELLLFISSPFEDCEMLDVFQKNLKNRNFIKDWAYIKQCSRSDEIESIKKINQFYAVLKNRFLLTKTDVNKRLSRTPITKKATSDLTMLRIVRKAFEEIVTAYEDYASLKKLDFAMFEILSLIMNIHLEETLDLIAFFEKEKEVEKLSLTTQRFLLDFYTKITSLGPEKTKILKQKNTLIFTETQEKLFEVLLNSIPLITNVIDPLLEIYYKKISPNPEIFSFVVKDQKKLKSSKEVDAFLTKLSEEHAPYVRENFLLGLNSQGVDLDLISENSNTFIEASDSLDIDSLHKLFMNFFEFSSNDFQLLTLLQEITSLKTRSNILNCVQEDLKKYLGHNTLLKEIKLSKIRIERKDDNLIELGFCLSRGGLKSDTEITQLLRKKEGQWLLKSLEAA